jgi:hypothetical protein
MKSIIITIILAISFLFGTSIASGARKSYLRNSELEYQSCLRYARDATDKTDCKDIYTAKIMNK